MPPTSMSRSTCHFPLSVWPTRRFATTVGSLSPVVTAYRIAARGPLRQAPRGPGRSDGLGSPPENAPGIKGRVWVSALPPRSGAVLERASPPNRLVSYAPEPPRNVRRPRPERARRQGERLRGPPL